jgi:hypothetical protein
MGETYPSSRKLIPKEAKLSGTSSRELIPLLAAVPDSLAPDQVRSEASGMTGAL